MESTNNSEAGPTDNTLHFPPGLKRKATSTSGHDHRQRKQILTRKLD